MKRNIIIMIMLVILSVVYGSEQTNIKTPFEFGVSFATGGRYDEVRSCVITPIGSYGGPAFEFGAFIFDYWTSRWFAIGAYIPVIRPIIFGAAFNTLQFIPEMTITVALPLYYKIDFLIVLGIGGSFHFGTGYDSKKTYISEKFFAGGPRFSLLIGPRFEINSIFAISFGAKPYIECLFNSMDGRGGLVVGGELDFQCRFRLNIVQ